MQMHRPSRETSTGRDSQASAPNDDAAAVVGEEADGDKESHAQPHAHGGEGAWQRQHARPHSRHCQVGHCAAVGALAAACALGFQKIERILPTSRFNFKFRIN